MVVIEVKKEKFLILVAVVLILVGTGTIVALWNSGKKVWHPASDIKISIGGSYYDLQEAVDSGLIGGGSCRMERGTFYMPMRDTFYEISFSNPFSGAPAVHVTPEYGAECAVIEITSTRFKLASQAYGFNVNWVAFSPECFA
jgi:hypothetical protein